MTFWRMQLHPNEPEKAVHHSTRSLGLGLVGLDFRDPPGDLTNVAPETIPANQRDYLDIVSVMEVGDLILIMAHHYPHALVRVVGPYNYIRNPQEELGVWFRHFRRVEVLGYYSDFITNPASWVSIPMTNTLGVLRSPETASYRLIEDWAATLIS